MSNDYDNYEDEVDCEKVYPNPIQERLFLFSGVFLVLFILLLVTWGLCGCTISMQNISTHGTASDLVDEEMTNQPVVSPNTNFTIPLKAI